MKTYWDDFNDRYQGFCVDKSLRQILEAFWYFCNGQPDKCDKLMKGKK